jgi:hypothetical protein
LIPVAWEGVSVVQEGLSITLRCLWWWQPLFYVCKPVVEIDGQAYIGKWGMRFFALSPGHHQIRVFFAYLAQKECGLATTDIEVLPGRQVQLLYKPPFTVLQAGKLKIQA